MPKIDYNIFEISDQALNPVDSLNSADTNLVESFEIKNVFSAEKNFIELNFFSLQNNIILSDRNYTNYSILQDGQSAGNEGASIISVDVLADVKAYGYSLSDVKLVYNFLNNIYSESSQANLLYLDNISPDRTEVRLLSTTLTDEVIETKTLEFLAKIQSSAYLTEFSLYSGNNNYITAINIGVQDHNGKKAVILKLYQPLANSVQLKDTFTVVEKICDSPAYQSNVTITPDAPVIPTLRSPNFSIEVDEQSTEPTEYFNYNELFSFPTDNTYRQLNSLFAEKGADLGIDYSEYGNFINFSSAEERVRNFKYKLQLIESYQTSLDSINTNLTNYIGTGVVGSREYFEGLINGVLDNFDHYERHLYYDSGTTSWPKGNTSRPYVNVESTTGAAITWFNTEVTNASNYDLQNPDILINSIPSYLKEDPTNDPYLLFIHMIGQHFDNLWLYTDVVSKKYDADNRLNRGVPKDLVEDLLKNFGVKLYTSNKSAQDLFRYFTADSYQIDDLEPNLEPIITGSNYSTSQNDYQKEIYKRIYHNLPLLMKSKGTERGLRALINCFGIPSETLKINLYGGQSSQNTPFFGGEQAWTGSLDKVRLDNTGSIVEGDTLSQYTAITKLDNFYTQDLHTIEVGFSPTHNVDTYILSQSAVLFPSSSFNIDDYIGDPREINTNTYFSLRDYADEIFTGVDSYDLKDFVRFIKFFDNVIFRMVRDFIPARAVADTGIIIKPHLLERSKYESPVMSWNQPEYTGSIDTAFITGSSGGAYESHAFNSSNGELPTSYVEDVVTPFGTQQHLWIDANLNRSYTRAHEEARFDGQLSGSKIEITDGELNRDNPYKTIKYAEVIYDVRFFKEIPATACLLDSLGTEASPYIIRSTENPFNLTTFFINATLTDYDYLKNDTPVPSPESVDFQFTGQQYGFERIQATSGSTCSALTIAQKVTCDVATNTDYPSDTQYVYTDQIYTPTAFFIANSNNDYTIYINNVAVIDPTLYYQFTGNENDLVDITFRDNVDPTCEKVRTFIIKECSLTYSRPPNEILLHATGVEYPRRYYNVQECFNNVNENTIYKTTFTIQSLSGNIGYHGPVDIFERHPNFPTRPILETFGNTWPTGDQPLNIIDGPDGIPISIPYEYGIDILSGSYPTLLTALTVAGWTYEDLKDRINLNTALTGVTFTARSTNQCAAGTPEFPLIGEDIGVYTPPGEVPSDPEPIETLHEVSLNYHADLYLQACSTNSVAVYVYRIGTFEPGQVYILQNEVQIYADNGGTELAPSGIYADQTIPPSGRIYRQWVFDPINDLGSWTGTDAINCPSSTT